MILAKKSVSSCRNRGVVLGKEGVWSWHMRRCGPSIGEDDVLLEERDGPDKQQGVGRADV